MQKEAVIFTAAPHKFYRTLMCEAWKSKCYNVTIFAFENGCDLLNELAHGQRKPDIILLHLKPADELSLITRIRDAAPKYVCPLVVVLASGESSPIKQIIQAGASCVFNKPVTQEEYLNFVDQLRRRYFQC